MTASSTRQPLNEVQEDMLAFFCDHLVSLAGTYVALDEHGRDFGEERFFAIPGFIIAVRGVWCVITAGHAIQEMDKRIGQRKYRLTNCCLGLKLGSKSEDCESFAFDHVGSRLVVKSAEEEGLDFAAMTINAAQREELMAGGVRAFSEENWSRQDANACELFYLLGLPNCLVGDTTRVVPHGVGVGGVVSPALVSVRLESLSPEEMSPPTHPWFVGRVGAAQSLPDIDGMSGGPLFGFRRAVDGQMLYWVLAVQSLWDRDSRIILACRVPVIGRLVEEELQRRAAARHGVN